MAESQNLYHRIFLGRSLSVAVLFHMVMSVLKYKTEDKSWNKYTFMRGNAQSEQIYSGLYLLESGEMDLLTMTPAAELPIIC